MHSRSTTHLGDTANGIFHFLGSNHHEVGQLVDNNDDLRQFLSILFSRCNAIIGFQITNAHIRHHLVSPQHFRHSPLKAACRLFRIGDNRNQKLRNAVVDAQLDHLGVHHDEFYFLGTGLIQKADDDGVHAHGFTGTGCTCNQQVGHLGNVAHDAIAIDAFTQSNGRFGLCIGKFIGIDYLPQGNRSNRTVGNFDADHRNLAGDSSDTDTGSAQAQCNVIGTAGQLIQSNTLIQFYLIAGNTGTAGNIDDMRVDVEACQGFVQTPGIFPHFLGAVRAAAHRTF